MKTNILKNEAKTFMSSRTLGEIAENIPWRWVYFVFFLPIFAFALNPLIKIISSLINPPYDDFFGFDIDYSIFISQIDEFAIITYFFGIILFIIKSIHNKNTLKEFAKENISFMFFIALVLIMIISTIKNGLDYYVLNGDIYRRESLFTFIMYFLVFYFSASQMKAERLKAILIYVYLAGSAVIGVCAIIHSCITELEAFSMNAGLATIFSNSNHYGYFLLIAICLSSATFIFEKNIALKIFSLAVFILNNVVLIINDTFGCWLAASVTLLSECIFICICRKKFDLLSAIPFIVFMLIAFIMGFWYDTIFAQVIKLFVEVGKIAENDEDAGATGSGRWRLWVYTMQYISEKPILGWGVEGIADKLYEAGGNSRPHNEYLQYCAFFGIPAGIIYIIGVALAFIKCLKNRLNIGIFSFAAFVAAVGYAISACFGNTMYYTAPFFFIFLGMAVAGCGSANVDSSL